MQIELSRWQIAVRKNWRGCVGIEPTRGGFYPPHSDFEDRAPHQQRTIPTNILARGNRRRLTESKVDAPRHLFRFAKTSHPCASQYVKMVNRCERSLMNLRSNNNADRQKDY